MNFNDINFAGNEISRNENEEKEKVEKNLEAELVDLLDNLRI